MKVVKNKRTFHTAGPKLELTLECSPQHLRIGAKRIKVDQETEIMQEKKSKSRKKCSQHEVKIIYVQSNNSDLPDSSSEISTSWTSE